MAAYYVDKPNIKILGCVFYEKPPQLRAKPVCRCRETNRGCGAMLRLRAAAAASLAGFTRAGATFGGLTPLARRSPFGALRSLTVRALAPPRIDEGKLPAGRKEAPPLLATSDVELPTGVFGIAVFAAHQIATLPNAPARFSSERRESAERRASAHEAR